MAQFSLPFKYEEEKVGSGLTGLAGLPLYLELMGWSRPLNAGMHRVTQ